MSAPAYRNWTAVRAFTRGGAGPHRARQAPRGGTRAPLTRDLCPRCWEEGCEGGADCPRGEP